MKVAVCGVWHVHAHGYTNEALNTEGVEVIGFYEEDEALVPGFRRISLMQSNAVVVP